MEGIKTVPAVLWVAFAALVFLTLRRALAPQLDRLSNVKTPVFEMSFAEQLLDEAAAKTQGGPAPSASERRGAVSRLEHAAECLAGGRILWVDDNPEWNVSLVRLFRQLGMAVDTSLSTQEALTKLEGRSYDLIISDMRRDSEQPPETAGITLIEALGQRGVRLPVIIFAVNFDPRLGVHPAIFAYTNFVDDLVQYVIDIMERIKFRAAF
ncbi:MAG TPA: response regulator [Planosporangium sp.]|nr:response regulator [Planosporangium sp.]